MGISWGLVTLLCLFGFLKEFRPSESFVTQYLVGPDKNFTKEQINQDIYPVGTYSNLSLLILVFLVTDWARYKPIIILEGLAGVAVYCLIIWGHDIPTIQVAEFFYGLFMATEVAYLTYMYAVCEKKHFQKVSGCVRAGILLGRFVSGLTSQLTISFNMLTYHELNFLTLAGVSLSVPVAAFLPSVKKSVYFHREMDKPHASDIAGEGLAASQDNRALEYDSNSTPNFEVINLVNQYSATRASHESSIIPPEKPTKKAISEAFRDMLHDFKSAFKNTHALKWSIWWALATCGYLQVTSYIQMLWQVTAEKDEHLYNGVVDAVYTLIGALASWFVGQQKINLKRYTGLVLTICSILQGSFLIISAAVFHLWVQYVLYILFKVLYHSTLVLASSEVAVSLQGDSHALIFGFNMFIALCLQSVFTLLVAAKGGFELDTRNQFFVYGSYFIILGIGFVLSICLPALFKLFKHDDGKTTKLHPGST